MTPPPDLRSELASSRFGPTRIFLLALLPTLLASLLLFPRPGYAETEVWDATLTVRDLGGARYGCDNASSGDECSSTLTDDDFAYKGADYEVVSVLVRRGDLTITLDIDIPTEMTVLILRVDGVSLALADSSAFNDNQGRWLRTGIEWDAGDTVRLSLVVPDPQIFPSLERLRVDASVQPRPANQDPYCYIGEGNSTTEYVRYPDGRFVEVPRVSDSIRGMFAC